GNASARNSRRDYQCPRHHAHVSSTFLPHLPHLWIAACKAVEALAVFGQTEFGIPKASAVAAHRKIPMAIRTGSESGTARLRIMKLKPQRIEQRRRHEIRFECASLSIPDKGCLQIHDVGKRIHSFSGPHAVPKLSRFNEQREDKRMLFFGERAILADESQ